MKAKDLQIGDWYEWHPDAIPSQMHYERVTAKTFGFRKKCFDAMNPIPLTTEILEKNGFLDIDDLGAEKCNGHNIYYKMGGGGYGINELGLRLYFVHQLQHALRLCGLDELADNFKIDRSMKVCKYYHYGHCIKNRYATGSWAHITMGCPFENKWGSPVAWRQRLFCKDYKK